MNAEEFYERFKENLDFLGCGFRGKENVTVEIKDGRFCMSAYDTEISFVIKASDQSK